MYDIVIAGAGPSGSSLARLLDSRYRVLVIDRRNLSDTSGFKKIKSCGGLISPDAQRELARQGLGVPHSVLTGPQIFTVRTIDIDNDIERYYQRHYINIVREKFDRWLFSLIPEKTERMCSCTIKNIRDEGDSVTIELSDGGARKEIRTKYLVGADGAGSIVRKHIDAPRSPEKYISIQELFMSSSELPYFSAIFDSTVSDFYSWTIPKGNEVIVGAALRPGRDAHDRFKELKEKLSFRGFDLSKSISREGAHIFRTTDTSQINTGTSNVFLTGEAAGFISPSSAEGFSYALKSSLCLASAFSKGGDIQGFYSRKCCMLKNNIFIKNFKSPAMYNLTFRKIIMKSGLFSMEVMGS